ncbi:MAG: electron transfer flavoprotein subunit alpha/FixB family protein [Bacteroidota bacterium]|nr:electron transfer flavoprotein subunit alpha/FixB family protein [Bacteroidota bacterium]
MNILVFAQNTDGSFKKSTLEAVSYSAQIAQQNGGTCTAVSIGNVNPDKLADLAKYGADKILTYTQDLLLQFAAETYSKVIAHAALNENAGLIVISNTYCGKSLAPRVAAQLKAGIASGIISFPDLSNGFKVRRSVFSGKAFADVTIDTAVKVIAITPNSFALTELPKTANIVSADAGLSPSDQITKSVEIARTSGKIVLTEAELVVSGGRGMKGPENWNLIEELADILGAATACSKPVSDMDWRPHTEHVGQTGITIKPNLYLAIGISGAIQHLAGVSSSKVIVAINKDPEAPLFKAADYGIVGDAFEVLPKIIAAAKEFKAHHG